MCNYCIIVVLIILFFVFITISYVFIIASVIRVNADGFAILINVFILKVANFLEKDSKYSQVVSKFLRFVSVKEAVPYNYYHEQHTISKEIVYFDFCDLSISNFHQMETILLHFYFANAVSQVLFDLLFIRL